MIGILLPLLLAQQVKLPPAAEIRPLMSTAVPDRDHLTLENILQSVEKHYPPLRVALLEAPIAEADYLAAQGRFDLVLRSFVDTNSLGFYESRRFDVSAEQPTALWGTSFFSGYQTSGGSFPSYDGKFQTNGLGEYRAGMRVPLFRDRAVDSRRAELGKANLGRRLADLGIQQQRLVILQAATARYWNWVAAGRRFAVAQSILDMAVEREKILETAVELGQLPRFEVLDNKRIIVPNSALMAGTITNFTANPHRRVDLAMAVGGDQDLAKAHGALLALANADPRVLKTPAATVANTKLIDNGTQVELRAWCKTPDYAALSSDLIAKAPGAFGQAGIKGPDRTIFYTERK